MGTCEVEDFSDGGLVFVIGEEDDSRLLKVLNEALSLLERERSIYESYYRSLRFVYSRYTCIAILLLPSTTKILFSVDNQPFSAGQILFKQRVARGEWYAIISTFDNEVDMGKHRFHLVEAGLVVTQKV